MILLNWLLATGDISNLVTKTVLIIKAREIVSEIPDTTGFITTPEFNGLTKTSFDVRIKEAAKGLARKSQVDNALDKADKSREKWLKSRHLY